MTTAGHNAQLTDEDRQKLFAHFFRNEMEYEVERRAIAAKKKTNRLNAKAAGFPSSKIDHYLKAHFGDDDQKPVDRLKSDRENLEWLALIPATTGGDLLKQIDRVDGEAMIRAKGYKAGLLNMDRASGYDGGSADDRLWLDSYDAGYEEFKSDIPDILARLQAAATNEEPEGDGSDPFPDDDEADWVRSAPQTADA